MEFFSFGQLRHRLIILVLMAVIPLAGLLFFVASQRGRQSVDAIERNVLAMAESAAREETQMLEGSRQLLVSLSLTLGSLWSTPPECGSYLSELLRRNPRYENFGAVTAEGSLLCSAAPLDRELDLREQAWFRQAVSAREFSIGAIRSGGRGAEPLVVLAYPVEANGGRLSGAVFAILEPHWLNRFNLNMEKDLPDGSTVAQMDEDGAILARHPDSQAWAGWPADRGALLDALRSKPTGMIMLPDPEGLRWFYAFAELRSTVRARKVIIVMGVPRTAVFEDANRRLLHDLTLLAGLTAVILLTAGFGSNRFVLRPVRAMLAATRRLTGGDLSVRAGISQQPGELNELAAAFDDMAAALETREAQRQQAEQKLRDSREELRNLAAHLESVREEERTRLAREIHDELGQALTALKMDTVWLNRWLHPDQGQLHAKTRTMEGLIDATILTVQRLSGQLRPGLLDDLGLAAAIEWQSEEFQERTGIPCSVHIDLRDTTLSREQATALFRIFQETLTNIVRHAQASQVEVRLQAAGARLTLGVADNGRGITVTEAEDPRAFGLIGMRERALAIKGEFAVSGEPGRGTRVTVSLPLDNRG